jgi:hypothetical protein
MGIAGNRCFETNHLFRRARFVSSWLRPDDPANRHPNPSPAD